MIVLFAFSINAGGNLDQFKTFDPYSILGVPEGATRKEAKTAFKALALIWHPDKNPNDPDAAQRFLLINKANSCFKNEETLEKCSTFGNPEGTSNYKVGIAIPSIL
jgi:translocation protein SEC63